MNATGISNGIKNIVAGIANAVYMRATDSDANTDVDHVDISGKVLCIYNNLPNVSHIVPASGSIGRSWPVEIRVVKLAQQDDNTTDGDTIRDECMAVADNIFDMIIPQFDEQQPAVMEYSLNFLGEVKIYDKTLTGVRLLFTLQFDRDVYYCPAP